MGILKLASLSMKEGSTDEDKILVLSSLTDVDWYRLPLVLGATP